MATLFVPESTHTRGYSMEKGGKTDAAITHQGDAGYGVSKTDRWAKDDRAIRTSRR